jgi:hypothetical protein
MKRTPAFAAVLLFAVPALAQWNSQGGYSFNNPTSALVGTMLNNRMWAHAMQASIARHQGLAQGTTPAAPAGEKAAPSAPRVAASATDFRPALPRYTVADATAEQQAKTPQQKAAFKQMFHLFVDAAENADGFRKNNVAWALSYVVLASLQVTTGKEISDAESVAFAQQLNDGMAASGVLSKMSAADQQRFYEGCLVMGGLVVGSWAEAQKSGDPKQQEHVRQLAKQVLASYGVK